ncbi:acyltransferase family protein [Microbaculum sp. FT89]|uniref:acyltransferase family protein n=1 Tax=Microbaculum sp. FT89 TaxID=3447298 RepID=UPI003F53C2EE
MSNASLAKPGRVDWVDIGKGFCIIMVVMLHSTGGVEEAVGAQGWLRPVIEFARPFRMPDFFLIAGLFLSRRIDRPWPEYTDKKVLHFAYFYVIWMAIQVALKTGVKTGIADIPGDFLYAMVQPVGALWFIYLLPIFFVVTKLLRPVHPAIVLVAAAIMQSTAVGTGWIILDEFAIRFVFFYAGYALAPAVFAFATRVGEYPWIAAAGLTVWALVNGALVHMGLAAKPGFSLVLGAVGGLAVVSMAVMLTRTRISEPLRYCGENSIVIFLAFFLPMATTRIVLLKTGIITDVGTMSLIVTCAAIFGSLILFWITRGTRLGFLFTRPAWARYEPTRRLAAAE